MGKKSSSELTLVFLLIAALCSDAFVGEHIVYYPWDRMNWTEARLLCQKKHVDLITESVTGRLELSEIYTSTGDELFWIGLLRDPEDESVWRWINLKTGEGLSGTNLSQSSRWADGHPNRHCVYVGNDLKWYSKKCSEKYKFYCSAQNKTQYHKDALTWVQASMFCQDHSTDIAIINMTNTDELQEPGWIGLYREGGETWSWIRHQTSDYRNWAEGEPVTADCGSFHRKHGTLHSKACSEKLRFICYDDNLVVVKENKTWEEALEHCRSMETPCEPYCVYRHKLLSLDSMSELKYIKHRIYRATTDEVWMGLRFLGGRWLWIDGKKMEDYGKLPHCPSQWTHCGTLSKNDTEDWVITRDCSERRNFICYKSKIWRF